MTTIYKYPLKITDVQTISVPDGARMLCVLNQGGALTLWAEVDTTKTKRECYIEIHGTGNPQDHAKNPRIYLGSAIVEPFVWHVYFRL